MGLHRGDEEGEDEFLPFAMERSDFQSGAAGKSDGKGGS
jgi:hypothetical protein